MPLFQKFRENWLRPALFFGNNPISLAGGAITTASGVTMISYWMAELFGHAYENPYLGIIFFLIPAGAFHRAVLLSFPSALSLRRKKLQKEGAIPAEYPQIDLNDRIFRHGLDIVLVATIVNLLVVAVATLSRRGLHGFAPVLRPVVPRDAPRVHGLPDLRALARPLRRVPHRHRRTELTSPPR